MICSPKRNDSKQCKIGNSGYELLFPIAQTMRLYFQELLTKFEAKRYLLFIGKLIAITFGIVRFGNLKY